MDRTKRSPARAHDKTHFWNWDNDENTGIRTLYLDGTVADESWWGDEITPRMFKDEMAISVLIKEFSAPQTLKIA